MLFACVFAGFGLRSLLAGLLFSMAAVAVYFGAFGYVVYCVLCALLWLVLVTVCCFGVCGLVWAVGFVNSVAIYYDGVVFVSLHGLGILLT